jgi:hypothetical protein
MNTRPNPNISASKTSSESPGEVEVEEVGESKEDVRVVLESRVFRTSEVLAVGAA